MARKLTLSDIMAQKPGYGCECFARGQYECGCDADWDSRAERRSKYISEMSDSEMRLQFGEMTAQEIRTVKAILKVILQN